MSVINDNLLVKGARGNVGKQFVYKKRGNNTHIARMPRVNKDAVATEKQEVVRDLFAEAAAYAGGAVASPELKKEYQKKTSSGNSAYNVAFRDFLKAPVVKRMDASKYNGTPGSAIIMTVKDDFRVVQVVVSIRTAEGVLVEEGNALLNPIHRNQWTYIATQANASPSGAIVSAIARDLPGNEGKLELTI